MAVGKEFSKGRLGAKGLAKKYGGDLFVAIRFEIRVGGCLVFHAAGPAVNMGGVWEWFEDGKIPGWDTPKTGGWRACPQCRRLAAV